MAAKPKLTPDEWANARTVWEADTRKGYPWLIDELKLPVSAEAVRLRANSEGWFRFDIPSLEKKTKLVVNKKPNLVNKESKVKVAIKETPVKNNLGGQPTLYRFEYNEQAYKLCLLGATDAEIADFFRVTEQTVNNWKSYYPEFFESMQRGKILADANISEKLYHRALGYSHEDEKLFLSDGEVIRAETTKHYPPDTGAARLWLLNRRPKDWRANVESPVEINLNLFPAKEVLDSIYDKALLEAAERDKFLVGRRERLSNLFEDGKDYD